MSMEYGILHLFVLLLISILYTCSQTLSTDAPLCQCYPKQEPTECECTNINGISFTQLTDFYPELCDTTYGVKSIHFSNITHILNFTDGFQLAKTNCDWNSLIKLTLSNTPFTRLNVAYFNGLSQLRRLNISNNRGLLNYGERSFQMIGASLNQLILSSNPVRSLTRHVFSGLQYLEVLILSDNKIGYIEAGVFANQCCQTIRELRLDQNILTVLDADSLQGLQNLEILDLRGNPLQMLDTNVFSPFAGSLMELRMSHDDQAAFGGFQSPQPNLFAKLNQLKILEMNQLKITNLTRKTFQGLSNLRELSLRGNRLIHLPPDVFYGLPNIERLDLSANWLICIPSAVNPVNEMNFLEGTPIQWIDLSWNRLTHLSQLTSRSLNLFDQRFRERRLVLNLTANPWQHIDDNTFCNPTHSGICRPIDLIMGPLPSLPFANWRTSLGLWLARAMWPNGPFALIGNASRIHGLMLDSNNEVDVYHLLINSMPYEGYSQAEEVCKRLEVLNETQLGEYVFSSKHFLRHTEIKHIASRILKSSIMTHCPRLSIRKLDDWELKELKVSNLISHAEGFARNSLSAFEQGSRLYLLVIVGICISFLFIALTAIMCYRAWSHRSLQKFIVDQDMGHTGTLLHGDYADSHEKFILLNNHRTTNSIPNELDKTKMAGTQQPQLSTLSLHTDMSHLPNTNALIDLEKSTNSAQPISESEVTLKENPKLTSLGLV